MDSESLVRDATTRQGAVRFLVTGASGFIGANLVRELVATGHVVHPMIRATTPPASLAPYADRIRTASLQDPAALEAAVEGMDVIVHLGGLTRARSEAEFMDTNSEGVARLVAAARRSAPDLRRFIYVSSLSAGGPSKGANPVSEDDPPRPVSAYGRSKLAGEVRLRETAGPMPWTIVRPPVVYGPGERDLYKMFRYARRGFVPLLGDDHRAYSFVYVSDFAAAIAAIAASPAAAGQVYYVAEDRPYRGRELLGHIAAAIGTKPRVMPVPGWVASVVAAAGSALKPVLKRPPLLTLDKLPELGESWVCSPKKLERECGFRCRISFQEGAAATAAWYRSEGWL